MDRKVMKWLDSFKDEGNNQKSQHEIEIYKRITKSGFEEDLTIKPPENIPAISLIVVTYNSDKWVENLRTMFQNLSPWLHEIIVIDNGSLEKSKLRLHQLGDSIKFIENEESKSFATAVNQGCSQATGELFLIINPDVYIPKSSLWSLINFYGDNNGAAAIVPKLMLMKTPGFINGIGNIVPPFRWGFDLGLGHLDIGQFDDIEEVPSACFATVIIPRDKWEIVGALDEEYPMYYEDSDWSYRARGLGYKILADTNSVVYHAFRGNQVDDEAMSKKKLFHVTYGRLRFITRNLNLPIRCYFLFSYFLFDLIYLVFTLIRKKINLEYAYPIINGWVNFLDNYRSIIISQPNLITINKTKKLNLIPSIKNGIPILNEKNLITKI